MHSGQDTRGWAAMLEREMRVRMGAVPETIDSPTYDDGALVLSAREFLFTSWEGVQFHYRQGEGITAHVPREDLQDDFELFLWGTVFGAVAWLNGMFPLHASAVELDGGAIGFTAESGGGKSTLATALSARGMPHICDDTLVLEGAAGGVVAVPDGKPVKLWASALELTGTAPDRPIRTVPGKFYAGALARAEAAVPFKALILLEEGPDVRIERVRGSAVLSALTEAMYRPMIAAGLGDRSGHGEWLMRLAGSVSVWRLERPRNEGDPAAFARTVDAIAGQLRNLPDG